MTPDQARRLAIRLHADQTDQAGQPYADHVCRVGDALHKQGASSIVVIAGYLHDAVEDGHATFGRLLLAGVPAKALMVIARLTKSSGDSYDEYLDHVAACPDACAVKRADLADNMNPDRLALLNAATQTRLAAKYAGALASL